MRNPTLSSTAHASLATLRQRTKLATAVAEWFEAGRQASPTGLESEVHAALDFVEVHGAEAMSDAERVDDALDD